jgi:RNA polymerase sigma-70 factor (ECF subfamily)
LVRLLLIDDNDRGDVVAVATAVADAGAGPVRVLVERRHRDRRRATERRAARDGAETDRRAIRNTHGRRVADRRGEQCDIDVHVALPCDARFVEATPLAPQSVEDAESARLVLRMQAGDRDALGVLYQRFFDKVYAYVRMALRDDHEAEDATQEVFMRAMRALPAFQVGSAGSVRGWLFRVARNQVVDRLRRRRAITVDPDDLVACLGAEDEEVSMLGFTDDTLLAHVRRLPQAQREVVVLRYALDFAGPEIAAVTGRTPAAVRQLHQRAMNALRAAALPSETAGAAA